MLEMLHYFWGTFYMFFVALAVAATIVMAKAKTVDMGRPQRAEDMLENKKQEDLHP